jgi:hypothetical protein
VEYLFPALTLYRKLIPQEKDVVAVGVKQYSLPGPNPGTRNMLSSSSA